MLSMQYNPRNTKYKKQATFTSENSLLFILLLHINTYTSCNSTINSISTGVSNGNVFVPIADRA